MNKVNLLKKSLLFAILLSSGQALSTPQSVRVALSAAASAVAAYHHFVVEAKGLAEKTVNKGLAEKMVNNKRESEREFLIKAVRNNFELDQIVELKKLEVLN